MSIFPFTQDVPELEERAAQELPVFRDGRFTLLCPEDGNWHTTMKITA